MAIRMRPSFCQLLELPTTVTMFEGCRNCGSLQLQPLQLGSLRTMQQRFYKKQYSLLPVELLLVTGLARTKPSLAAFPKRVPTPSKHILTFSGVRRRRSVSTKFFPSHRLGARVETWFNLIGVILAIVF